MSNRVDYIADGQQSEFNFTFRIFDNNDITVYVDSIVTNDYTLTRDDVIGGKVIFITPPSDNSKVAIVRRTNIQRTAFYPNTGELRSSILNEENDHIYAILQEHDSDLNRVLKQSAASSDSLILDLPDPQAGRALIWNNDGSQLINSDVNISNIGDASAAAAQRAEEAAERAAQYDPSQKLDIDFSNYQSVIIDASIQSHIRANIGLGDLATKDNLSGLDGSELTGLTPSIPRGKYFDITQQSTTSQSWQDVMTITVTPQTVNTKYMIGIQCDASRADIALIGNDGTVIANFEDRPLSMTVFTTYAPATTSEITFKLKYRSTNGQVATIGNNNEVGYGRLSVWEYEDL